MKKKTIEKIFMKNRLGAFLAAALLIACQQAEEVKIITKNPTAELSSQLAGSVLWYQQADEARFLYQQGYARAEKLMLENASNLPEGVRAAVVLDIDETVLDNSPYEARLVQDSGVYTSESWAAWVEEAAADTLPGVTRFLRKAAENNIAVFYISNRKESGKAATIKNLKAFDLPFAGDAHVLLKTTTSDKTERREKVLKEHAVVVYVGDQMTDFAQDYGDLPADSVMQYFVLLPNPMYGGFEEKIYEGDYKATAQEKLQMRNDALKTKR